MFFPLTSIFLRLRKYRQQQLQQQQTNRKHLLMTFAKLTITVKPVCTTTTLGTLNLWLLLTGGRCSEVVVSSGLTVQGAAG